MTLSYKLGQTYVGTSIMINVAIYFVEIPRVRKNLIDVGWSRVACNIWGFLISALFLQCLQWIYGYGFLGLFCVTGERNELTWIVEGINYVLCPLNMIFGLFLKERRLHSRNSSLLFSPRIEPLFLTL